MAKVLREVGSQISCTPRSDTGEKLYSTQLSVVIGFRDVLLHRIIPVKVSYFSFLIFGRVFFSFFDHKS